MIRKNKIPNDYVSMLKDSIRYSVYGVALISRYAEVQFRDYDGNQLRMQQSTHQAPELNQGL